MWSGSATERPFWQARLARAWERAPIVWLMGVRRVGKTTLARQLQGALLLNCDLPSTARRLEDLERFYASLEAPIVVFDEIHQLADPTRLLKVGADEFPHLKILATGSATLAAADKFRDTLTGRKRVVRLVPVLARELVAFGITSLERRLLQGGLPDALLASAPEPELYAEWLDSYFARDVQELFRVEKRAAFLQMTELLLRQSGSLLEVTTLAKHAGLSRPTALSYLGVLELTNVVTLLRPFHGGGRREILQQPKVYGFDTGFVSYVRGWQQIEPEHAGLLWEHLVLETLQAQPEPLRIHYWRDKEQREVDFVLPRAGGRCDALECKWRAEGFSPRNLAAFRSLHPEGLNFVLSPQIEPPYLRELAGLRLVFCNLEQWESGEAERLSQRTDSR